MTSPHPCGPLATITSCRRARHHGGLVLTVLCPTCGLGSKHGLADDEPLLPASAERTGRCGREYRLVDTHRLLPHRGPTKDTPLSSPIDWSQFLDPGRGWR